MLYWDLVHRKLWTAVFALSLLGQDELVFRSSSNFIAVDVQVLSGEHAVTGLQRNDFRVWDNGKPQAITSFGSDDQELDVILLIDTSQSTTEIQGSIKTSAGKAMAHLLPHDRVGVVIFADEARLAVPTTEDRAAVKQALENLPPGRGGTELNATVLSAARYLAKHARSEARRAIVMMSDNHGYLNVEDQAVREALWETNTVFNLLLFPGKPSRGKADVREFVRATGGEAMPARAQGVPLAELFQRLRQRYWLLYAEPPGKPGEYHQIRVELSEEAKKRVHEAKVRARSGYVATQ